MEWVETTGRTVAEALDAALDELGVDEDEAEFEVLAEPRGGLFGRLASGEARIRARVRPVSREKPGDRRRHTPRGSSAGRGAKRAGGTGPQERGRGPAATTGPTGGRDERPARSGPRGSRSARTDEDSGEGRETMAPELTLKEQAERAEVFTRELIEAFNTPAQVAVTVDDEETILVAIEGSSLGLLVGPRGATLHAIEDLVRTVVQRQTEGRGARINVDVGGYQAKRRLALENFTRDLAAKVLETGREQALEPMGAADRKVVHDVVTTIDGVATVSEGEEPRRRVVLRRG
ncbi:MAG: KH domain-containing protein [Actinobacteria bacterium]|nr:MAG: KH domain-containing protein [Actinomycetota bacterium]